MATRIGISNAKFTINEAPTFLLGLSYFDGVHARQSDLPIFQARGFKYLRVFLDWVDFDTESVTRSGVWSHFNADGTLKAAKSTLLSFIQAASDYGLAIELVILNGTSDGWMTTGTARTDAVTNAVTYFGNEPNVFFDVINEAEQCAYITAMSDITAFITTARAAHASVILAASVSAAALAGDGPLLDNSTDAIDTSYATAYMGTATQLCSFHQRGSTSWWWKKGVRVKNQRVWLDANGYGSTPIHINEDNRWNSGYGDPGAGDISADKYLTTMLDSRANGAASCIHHNNACFDLSSGAAFQDLFSNDTERDVFFRLGRAFEEYGVLTPFNLVDGFNRTNEGPPLSLDWVTVSGNGQKVISNQAGNNAGSTTANDLDVWGAYLYKNQRIRAQLAVVPRSGQVEYAILTIRVGSLHAGYNQLIEVEIDNTTSWRTRLYVVSGGYTQLESTYTGTITANDYIELRAVDGTITVLVNDVAVITAVGAQFIAPGYAGVASFHGSGTSAVRWNDVQVGAIYSPKLSLARTAVR